MRQLTKEIKIVYYNENSYSKFVLNHIYNINSVDLLIFGKNVFENINLVLPGFNDQKILKELAYYSKNFNCVVVCNSNLTTTNGLCNGAIIFENGKLIGISEQVFVNKKTGGVSVNFYDVKFGRVGILIAENCEQFEFFQLADVFDVNLQICFCNQNNFKLKYCCGYYASSVYGLNSLFLYDRKIIYFPPGKTLNFKNIYKFNMLLNYSNNKNYRYNLIHKIIYDKQK